MSTFVHEYLTQLDVQWNEVDVLLGKAEEAEGNDVSLYNALCRSASILIIAHLEGFIKDLSKNIVRDFNENLKFAELPKQVQETYCKKFIGFDNKAIAHYSNRLNDMIEDLKSSNDFKIDHKPFLFDGNRNPKPDSIKLVLSRFGICNIFSNLNECKFDKAFESSRRLERSLPRAKKIAILCTRTFPYTGEHKKFGLSSKKQKNRTLWEEFLDNANHVRHNIVHGNSFGNSENLNEIRDRKNKAILLQLIVVYLLCSHVCKDISN